LLFLVYDKDVLIGITGIDVDDKYSDTIWLDWFTILPEYRRKGYGKKYY
jgi:GNAT superfamily N-acetyltransferase